MEDLIKKREQELIKEGLFIIEYLLIEILTNGVHVRVL